MEANSGKTKLDLPDLDHTKAAVLASLRLPESQRSYRHAIDEFVGWYCSEPHLSFNKTIASPVTESPRRSPTGAGNYEWETCGRAQAGRGGG